MANEKQEISIRHIKTQLNKLTNLLPLLADREHPAGQLWSEIQRELNHLTQDLDLQEMSIDQQRIEQVITLHNISSQLGGRLDLKALLDDLAQYSAKLMDADASIVNFVDGSRQKLSILASYNRPDTAKIPSDFENSSGKRVSHQVFQSKQAVLANDWPNHPLAETESQAVEPSPKRLLALLAVPIISQNEVIGTIEVLSFTEQQAFDENDLHMLSLLAGHAATAIKNTQLFNRAENNYRFLKTVIEHIPDPIFIKDKDHTMIEMNQANAAIIGRTEEEIIGKTDHDFFPPELADKFRRRDDQVFTSNELFVAEDKTVWADGQEHIAYTRLVPMPDPSGRPQYLLGITRDVTKQKAEELEREQLLVETTALYEGSQAISSALSERQIFNVLFQQLRQHDPCEVSAYRFHLVDDELLWAELVANWQKMNNPTYPEKTRFYLPDHTQAGLLTTSKPIFIDDIATDSRLTEAERASFEPSGACSVALLPLATAGQHIGTVLVYFTKPYRFTDTVRRLWTAFLDQVSVSLLNQQFIQKSAYRAVQMDTAAEVARVASSILDQQELLASTVASIRDRFDLYYVGVFLIDETAEWAILRAGTGEAGRIQIEQGHRLKIGGESMIGWAVQNRQPRIALDVGKDAVHFQNPHLPKTRSEMALPLIHRGKILGALTIQSVEQAAFSREDIIFLQTMTDQLAVAIDNARLFSQVQASEARYRELVENANSIIIRMNTKGEVIFFNEFAQRFFGYPEAEIVGKNIIGTIVPETDTGGHDLTAMIKDIISSPEQYATNENENMRRNGERVWVAWTNKAVFDENQQLIGILCVGNDITERRQTEQALRNSEALYVSLVESLPQYILRKDLDGRFTFANQRYCARQGKPLDEIVGLTDFDLYPPELAETYYQDDQLVIKSQQVLETVEERMLADGSPLYMRVVKTPSYDANGQVIGIQAISWDVTERKQMENALATRERYMAALVEIQTQLLAFYEVEDYYPKILEALGQVSNASRIYIFENQHDPSGKLLMSQKSEWCAAGIKPQINDPTWQNLPYQESLPRWAEMLEAGETISSTVDGLPESERVILEPQGVLAVLILPLIVNGEFFGFIGLDNCVQKRTWEQSEVDLLLVAAAAVARWHERRLAREALAYERDLLQTLMDNSPDHIFLKDRQSRLVRTNKAHAQMLLGMVDPQAAINKTDFDFFPEKEAQKFYDEEQRIMETGQPVIAREWEVTTSAGVIAWMSEHKLPLTDETGQIVGLMGLARDITDQKQAELALAEERNLLRTMIDTLPEYIYAKDVEGRFLLGNTALARLMNVETPDELVGKRDSDFYPPDLAEQYRADEQTIIDSGQSLINYEEPNFDRQTGKEAWTATTKVPLRDTRSQIIGLVGVSHDITERKLAEQELQESRHRLRTILEAVQAGIVIIDAETRVVVDANPAALQLMAAEREELIGTVCHQHICPTEWGQCPVCDLGQEVDNSERVLLTTHGETVPILKNVVPATLGGRRHLIESFVNITERKQAEEALHEALRKSQLLYNISEALTTMTDRQAALETVLGEFILLLNLSRGNITLFDPTSGRSKVEALYLDHKVVHPESTVGTIEGSLAQYLMENPFPLVIDNVDAHPLTEGSQVLQNVKAMLLIPLITSGEVIGAMSAEATEEGHTFSQEDAEAGKAISDQLAIWLENRQLVDETEHRSNLLVTGAQVSAAASSILDLDELINRSVNLIRDQFDFYYVGLFLVDRARKWAVLRAGTGDPGRIQIEKKHRLAVGGESMIGWAVQNRQARIALDVGEDAVHFQNPYLPDTHSEMALPLISRDEVIGALTVQSIEPNAFTEEDITVLQTMADQLANAIANARLFDNVMRSQKAAETLLQETQALQQLSQALAGTLEQDEILELFFQACTQEIGFEYVVLSLVDKDKNVVQAIAGVGVHETQITKSHRTLDSRDIMADIVRTGKTEVLSGWDDRFDEEMYESEGHADWVRLFTPIILRRESIGLVEAGFNKNTLAEIKDSQIRLLRAFIDQTALALDNAQRYEASLRAARHEALIKEITTKVRASTELDDILQTTVKEIGDAIGGKRTYVHLIPPANGETEARS